MQVKTKIKIYEMDSEDVSLKSVYLTVSSEKNHKLVSLGSGEKSIVVSVDDLIKAIQNATNI